jgi:hypothetical protein
MKPKAMIAAIIEKTSIDPSTKIPRVLLGQQVYRVFQKTIRAGTESPSKPEAKPDPMREPKVHSIYKGGIDCSEH